MRKSGELSAGAIVVLVLVGTIGLPILLFLLFYGIVFCWAGVKDLESAYIARTQIDPQAAQYIAQTYPDNDFVVDDAYYVFKDNCYRVKVHSPSSQDTYFYLTYDYKNYDLTRDSYDSQVVGGENTLARLQENYAVLIDECLTPITYLCYISGDFCKYSESTSHDGYFSPEGLEAATLIVDKDYDIGALGSQYGYLEVTAILPAEEVNISSALEVMLEIDQQLADKNIGYYLIEITIQDAKYPVTTVKFDLYGVHPEDLHREDALAYLQELWDEQEAHRQELKKQWDNE